jgi:pyrimidine-specific ribonucleoside hydrolase
MEAEMNYLLNHLYIMARIIITTIFLAACLPRQATTKPPDTAAPAAAITSNPPTPAESARTPVLIDSDMSADAIMAILYLLQRQEFNVAAITVAGTGEAHCGPGVSHARGLIALLKAGDIPVACGRETPLSADRVFPSDLRSMADSPLGITWPTNNPSNGNRPLNAVDLLKQTLETASRPVIFVTDGPLTNLGELFMQYPALAHRVQMIYSMGGAINVPGNLFGIELNVPNTTAEFNLYIDPPAANIVLNSGAPVTLVPLDATNQVPLDRVFYKLLSEHQVTPAAKAVYEMLTETKLHNQQEVYFWDPLAYAIASDESLAQYETKKITVIEEGPEAGRTKVSQEGTEVRVAMNPDADRFIEAYLSTLNGGQKINIDWTTVRETQGVMLTVTMADGKCVSEGSTKVPFGEMGIKFINLYPDRIGVLGVVTIDEGKSFSDLDAWPETEPPPWVEAVGISDLDPGSENTIIVEVGDKALYLVCLETLPGGNKLTSKTWTFGPIVGVAQTEN